MALKNLTIKANSILNTGGFSSAEKRAFQPTIHSSTFLRRLGELAIGIINERTQDGFSKTGKVFVKYSAAYADRVGTSRADLTLTGDMLDSFDVMRVRTRLAQVEIGFRSGTFSEDKARWHSRGLGNNPKRDFYGITNAELVEAFSTAAGDTNGV